MTCVSEQGKTGLLWTVFEGEPFCSNRIASFSNDSDAREYLLLKQGHTGSMEELRTIEKLRAELDELQQKACDECDGDGWNYNAVEGKHPCACIEESGPYIALRTREATLMAELETANLCVKGLEGNLAALEKENAALIPCAQALQGFLGDGDIEKEITDARAALTALTQSGVEL